MLRKIYGTNFFHMNSRVVLTSNVKMDQCCPQLMFFFNGQALIKSLGRAQY
jgi:hypothetical protein